MPEEIETIKQIVKKYMKGLKGIDEISIISARRIGKYWKVVIRYNAPENPDMTSMLILNWETKKIDSFREDILPY